MNAPRGWYGATQSLKLLTSLSALQKKRSTPAIAAKSYESNGDLSDFLPAAPSQGKKNSKKAGAKKD